MWYVQPFHYTTLNAHIFQYILIKARSLDGINTLDYLEAEHYPPRPRWDVTPMARLLCGPPPPKESAKYSGLK